MTHNASFYRLGVLEERRLWACLVLLFESLWAAETLEVGINWLAFVVIAFVFIASVCGQTSVGGA